MAASSSMDTEAAGQELKGSGYTVSATAHAVDSDSWQQVGLLLVIGFNCAYVLSFSNLMMAPLGWGWGITCLLLVGAAAWYGNWLLAGLHFIDGQRFIRYRDLMGFVFVHHSASLQHGLHLTRCKSTQGNQCGVHPLPCEAPVVHHRHRDRLLRLRLLRADDFCHEELARHVGGPDASIRHHSTGHTNQRWEIERAEGFQCPCWQPIREGVQRTGRRRRHPRLQHLRPAPGDTVDGAGAGGARHAAGAAAAVHGRRGGVLRRQRGGVLGVRVVGVGVPPQRARRAALGRRAHQRRRLPAEHRLPTPVRGADPRGDGHAAAAAGRGHVLQVQPDAAPLRAGAHLRLQRLRHRAVPVHGRLRQPHRLLRARPAHLHVPQHGHPKDQREEWWEMEQALALGHHRFLHGSLRRYNCRCSSFDLQQCQDLPLLRRYVVELINYSGIYHYI